MIKELQVHPVFQTFLHVDFYEVAMDRKIKVKVPVVTVGKTKGVELGGTLQLVRRELDVLCLPRQIPNKIEVDTTNLDIGDSIHVEEIPLEGDIEGSVEISHSQLGGAERFDIVIFSQRSVSIQLEITYNIAYGSFTTPLMFIGIVLMVLGFSIGYIQDRRIRAPFMDIYAPDGHGKPESSSSHYVDSGMTDSAKMEPTTSNFSAQTTSSSTAVVGEKCPYCGGGPITASDIFCPSCFTEV